MTNGVVSVLLDCKMAMKIVVGDNGYNAQKVADKIIALGRVPMVDEARALCREIKFGCRDCLVIQTPERDFFHEELGERYRSTFNDPEANPRWEHKADHTIIVRFERAANAFDPERVARYEGVDVEGINGSKGWGCGLRVGGDGDCTMVLESDYVQLLELWRAAELNLIAVGTVYGIGPHAAKMQIGISMKALETVPGGLR